MNDIVQQVCPKGHFYDGNRYSECPYCKGNNGGDNNVEGTTMVCPNGHTYDVSKYSECPFCKINEGHQGNETTVVTQDSKTGIMPVAGWLVCTKGLDQGRDFRLHFGANTVGRDPKRSIVLKDPSVSRVHFTVSYDQIHHRYFVSNDGGREFVYVNEIPLGRDYVALKNGDKIEVANTVLYFIALDKKYVDLELSK